MSVASRPVSTGKTRTCPHCKATILESLSICPGCMHHLRFDSEAARRQVAATSALRVEGVIRHPPLDEPLEYYVIIAIRNDRGEEVTRQVVNVGALQAAEKRTFTLSVEVLPPQAPVPPSKSSSSTGTFRAPGLTAPPSGTTINASPTASAPSSSGAAPQGARPPGSSPPAASGAGTASASPPSSGAKPLPKSSVDIKPPPIPTHTVPSSPRLTPSNVPPGPSQASVSNPSASNPNTSGVTSNPGSNPNPAPNPNTGKPLLPNTSGAPRPPASNTPKPQPSYPSGLKPPNPGGPKRH
jgi:hypothetical protein